MSRLAPVFGVLGILAIGCQRTIERPAGPPQASADFLALAPAWISNGIVGVRLGRMGDARNTTGWTPGVGTPAPEWLPAFVLGGYLSSGEERILEYPNPIRCEIMLNGRLLEPSMVTGEGQHIGFSTGILTTTLDTGEATVAVTSWAAPREGAVRMRWLIRAKRQLKASITLPSPPGREVGQRVGGPPTPESPILQALARSDPSGDAIKPMVAGRNIVFSGDAAAGQAIEVVARYELTEDRELARRPIWDFEPAERAPRIVIDGPKEDQEAIDSFVGYLRMSIDPDGGMAVSPMALSSSVYHGHVFWDADVWVFPALALVDPGRAATIPQYRVQRAEEAERNYFAWVASGRPVANGTLGAVQPSDGAMMFPWESSVTGRETVPGPSRFQHHISGTVAFSLEKASALGLVSAEAAKRVGEGVARFYLDRSEKRSDGSWGIRATMSPDEHHTGDNDLYTNLVAERAIRTFLTSRARTFYRPRDAKSLLTYDGDLGRGYKQAAAVLAIYPLQDPEAEKQARVMLDRFEGGVIDNGPAMSDSIHALIRARLGEPDRAYDVWRRSWMDFTQPPLMLFSEKRRRERTYFTTGAAGCLQTVIYGFLGARLDPFEPHNARAKLKLRDGWWLSFNPHLPKAWKSVHWSDLSVLGKKYHLMVTRGEVRLTEGES